MEGIRKRLAERGLGDSMMLGLAGDAVPTKAALETLAAAAPKAKWVRQQHGFSSGIDGHAVGYLASVWGVKEPDAQEKPGYGWRNAFWVTSFCRNALRHASLAKYRIYAGGKLSFGGRHWTKFTPGGLRGGVGRLGADFWRVLKDKRGRPRYLVDRYPESGWGALRLTAAVPHFFSPGRDGAVSTARFEMLRENVQESEAWALVEDAAGRPEVKARVGADLARRALKLLDARRGTYRRLNSYYWAGGSTWYVSSGWREKSAELYRLAGEIAAKLGVQR